MALHQKAGLKAGHEDLDNIPRLMAAYYLNTPNLEDPEQLVSFGTSGHRGSSLNGSFTESHIIAISQAIARASLSRPTASSSPTTTAASTPSARTAPSSTTTCSTVS